MLIIKTNFMKRLIPYFLFVFVTIFFLSGCTRTVRLQVMRPAVIDVPKDIQSLATANRYKPDKGHRIVNVLEGLVSGEGIGTDRRGAEACLQGLSNILMVSPRYKFAQLAIDLKGTGTANFPDPLPSDEVKRLCELAKSDALVTIEAFDSDSRLDYGTKTKSERVNNANVDVLYHTVNAGIRVTVGWRLYRASDGAIVDQYRMVETVNFNQEGRSKEQAVSRLPSQERMTQDIGNVVGNLYATRISPALFWVNREYYGSAKGAPDMKLARKLARVNNWNEAAKIWKPLSNDANPKTARRAMFNLAVANEVLGDLNSAVDWSEKAYKMGLQRALEYNGILRQRIFDQQRLDNQLSKPE
jgi:hypothetical protein